MSDVISLSSSDEEPTISPPKKKIKPIFLGDITPQVTLTRVNKTISHSGSTIVVHELSDDDDVKEVKDESCVTIEDDVEPLEVVYGSNEDCTVKNSNKFVKCPKITEDADVIKGLKNMENVQVVEDCEISDEISESNCDKEEGSGKENKTENDNNLNVTSQPSTSSSIRAAPNTSLFTSFVNAFIESIKCSKFNVLESKIPTLKKYFEKCEMGLGESTDFEHIVQTAITKAKSSAPQAVIGFNEIFQYLKEVLNAESVEVTAEKRVKLKKLEKTIKLLVAKIKSLEDAEINFEDEEDSTYLQLDRYTNRLKKVHHKYCELLEKNPYSGRLTYSKLDFSDSEFNEINRAISKKYKNNKKFPSYLEMQNFIKKISEENNLELSDSKIKSESIHCFRKLGELLQNRRRRELYDSHYAFIKESSDPAKNDPALNLTLTEQYAEGQNKIEKIVQEYVNKQQNGVEANVISEESSDASNYVDSDENEDVVNADNTT